MGFLKHRVISLLTSRSLRSVVQAGERFTYCQHIESQRRWASVTFHQIPSGSYRRYEILQDHFRVVSDVCVSFTATVVGMLFGSTTGINSRELLFQHNAYFRKECLFFGINLLLLIVSKKFLRKKVRKGGLSISVPVKMFPQFITKCLGRFFSSSCDASVGIKKPHSRSRS